MDNINAQRLIAAINRHSEISALVAVLQGSQCVLTCGRFGTKSTLGANNRYCDSCAAAEDERLEQIKKEYPDNGGRGWRNIEWEELPSAKRARRLEALLTGEADQCVNYNY